MEANWQRQWAEHDAANPPNEKDGQQSLLIQKLMRLAVEVFEHRRYLGTVEVSWMFGIYQESATIWIDDTSSRSAAGSRSRSSNHCHWRSPSMNPSDRGA